MGAGTECYQYAAGSGEYSTMMVVAVVAWARAYAEEV